MRSKPKKKYNPADFLVECGDGIYKTVDQLTIDELRHAICREVDFSETILSRIREIETVFENFGWTY